MKIRELLAIKNRPVVTINSEETVFDAIQKLNVFNRSSIPVVDEDEELMGIITERDVVRKCFNSEGNFNNHKIKYVMTRDVAVGFPDDDLQYAVSVMRQKRVRHLPILNEDRKVIGLVSMRDMLDMQLNEVESEVRYTGMICRRSPRLI